MTAIIFSQKPQLEQMDMHNKMILQMLPKDINKFGFFRKL